MKQRCIAAVICGVISLATCMASFPKYNSYLSNRKEIALQLEEIAVLTKDIGDLSAQFESVRGKDTPKTLKDIISFMSLYEDVEIIEIKSFNVDGAGVSILNNITSVSDDEICDGYEITILSDDLLKFIQYLDTGKLSYHSVDFMFGAKTAILRVRVGGGLFG